MEINKNILSLKDEFNIFFFDSYGVLWNGSDFYNGVLNTLEELILSEKIVIIVSNATTLSSGAIKKYAEKGLIEGKHFHNITNLIKSRYFSYPTDNSILDAKTIFLFAPPLMILNISPFEIKADVTQIGQ